MQSKPWPSDEFAEIVRNLRAEYIGPGVVHAGLRIEVQRGLPIEEADRIAHQVHDQLHQGADSGYCIMHVDVAEPLETMEAKK